MRTIITDTIDERVEFDIDTGSEYHYRKDYLQFANSKTDLYSMSLSYLRDCKGKVPIPTPDTIQDCNQAACQTSPKPLQCEGRGLPPPNQGNAP